MGELFRVWSRMSFVFFCFFSISARGGNDNAFTYQGLLSRNDGRVTALCDLTLSLWDAEIDGNQIGPINSLNSTVFDEGLFTVQLDFGVAAFSAQNRWLETDVQCPGDATPITLFPRQELSASPRSFHALRASLADSATQAGNADALGGRPASDYITDVQAGMGLTAERLGGSVTMSIATAGVVTDKIASSAVVSDKIAIGAVNSGKIADESITSADIQANAVESSDLKSDPLSLNKVSGGAMSQVGNRVSFYTLGDNPFVDLPKGVHIGGAGGAKPTIQLSDNNVSDGQVKIDFSTTNPDFNVRIVQRASDPDELLVKGHNGASVKLVVAGSMEAGSLEVTRDMSGGSQPTIQLSDNNNPTGQVRIDLSTTNPDFNVRIVQKASAPNELLVKGNGGSLVNLKISGTLELTGNAFKPGGGSWAATSDRRLKKNIAPLRNALSRLLRLRGVSFEYKNFEESRGLPGTQIGLIAQEVEEVFPDWVGEDKTGYKTVTVRGLAALVVEALREIRVERGTELQELRNEIVEIQQQLAKMEASRATHRSPANATILPAVPSIIIGLGMLLMATFAFVSRRKRGAR